eukprot:s2302_g6.t1
MVPEFGRFDVQQPPKRYPAHGIIGEEFGSVRTDAKLVWVLDPIDGTKSFITGKPLFGTLIALLRDGRPILGVIDQCVLRERWVGANGQTVFNKQPIRAGGAMELKEAMMYATTPHMFGEGLETERFEALRSQVKRPLYGCDCYAYGLCASGFGADLVVEADLGIYDYMALVPVVINAGGCMSDWQGQPLTLQSHEVSKGRVVAAATPELWEAAVKATGEVYGRLARDPSRPRYVLTKMGSNPMPPLTLLFDGLFKEHAVLASDGIQAEPAADAEPCSMSFDPQGTYYRLRVSSNVDVGLMICCLLSIDDSRRRLFKTDSVLGAMRWREEAFWSTGALGQRFVPVETDYWMEEGFNIMQLKDFIQHCKVPSKSSNPSKGGYLAQHALFDQLPCLEADLRMPDLALCGDGDSTVLRQVFFGPEGTVTPLHSDPYENIFCQVVGVKYLRLYAPSESQRLYAREGDMKNNSRLEPVDVLLADAATYQETFPEFLQAEFQDVVLHPGDVLYLPVGWWHFVKSFSTSISVAFHFT